jgi:hypothetical protein
LPVRQRVCGGEDDGDKNEPNQDPNILRGTAHPRPTTYNADDSNQQP